MRDLQKDMKKDNEKPGAEKLFMFLLDFIMFHTVFRIIDQIKVCHMFSIYLKGLFSAN